MEGLPDEILVEILGIGIEKSILTCSDICSVSVCCKHLNRICNEDDVWCMLLTLDFPEYENNVVVSYSKKCVYKCRLGRWYKRRIGFLHLKLDDYEDRTASLDKRIDKLERRLGVGDPSENFCGQLLDMLKQRNFLLPGFLDETARARIEEATTKSLQWETWAQDVTSVISQMIPLASHAPSTSYLSGPVGSSPFDPISFRALLVDMKKKLSSFNSLYSSLLENKRKHGIFHYRIKKRHAQIAALDHRIALLSACFDFKEAYDDTAKDDDDDDDDYDYYDAEYDTEDDDGNAVSSDDDGFDYDTEDDDGNAVSSDDGGFDYDTEDDDPQAG